jgi:hypothetical protein
MTAQPRSSWALDPGALDIALDGARRREAELDAQIDALGTERHAVREERELLERIKALQSGGFTTPVEPKHDPRGDDRAKRGTPPATKTAHPAVQEAIRELDAAGRPLHISELMRLLEERDVPIPGAGAQANLIAHLSRSDQIVRPSRGMYALSSWGLPERPMLKRAKRRRTRSRAAPLAKTQQGGIES